MFRLIAGRIISSIGTLLIVGLALFVLTRSGPDRVAFTRTLEATKNLDLGTTAPLTFSPDRHLGGTATQLLRLKGGKYIRVSEALSYGEAAPS